MAKRLTLSSLNDALLQLARAVEEYTRKNDAYWERNDERWARNDERWARNDERWARNDERWNENALLLSSMNRRVTNVEMELSDFRTETRESFARIERRLESVEAGK